MVQPTASSLERGSGVRRSRSPGPGASPALWCCYHDTRAPAVLRALGDKNEGVRRKAAYALGMNYWQAMGTVVLPQAFRNMVPIMLTQAIILFQDTSLVYVVGLKDFLGAIQDADVVLGSRYLDGKVTIVNWPMSRLMLSYFANVYARWFTGCRIWDLTGGFKCFRRRVLEAIDLSAVGSNGYAFQIEMSVRAWRKGFKLREIPIVFVDRAEGQSKMNKAIVREAVWKVLSLRLMAWFGRI